MEYGRDAPLGRTSYSTRPAVAPYQNVASLIYDKASVTIPLLVRPDPTFLALQEVC